MIGLPVNPKVLMVEDLLVGARWVYALLVTATGAPAATVEEAVGLVHIQRRIVERGAQAGDWVRFADRRQVATWDMEDAYPDGLLVLDTAQLAAHSGSLRGKNIKAMRCNHVHDLTAIGWVSNDVWATLKADPATGRQCWACDTGHCLGRTRLFEGQTYDVQHTRIHAKTCTEAYMTPKKLKALEALRAAEAKEAAEVAAAAQAAADKKAAALAKRRATIAAKKAAAS